uniref:Uncharacterized protein n=1 Tax=Vibrio parahaemolyticus TaxID=670 RepID=A0A1Y1BGP6_VIBPH|nr:hypothetical protein [Vibrio parahaemolyticus]BAX57039.1 hypothetical protein [Vibrio parahaemolyticus]
MAGQKNSTLKYVMQYMIDEPKEQPSVNLRKNLTLEKQQYIAP